MAKPLKIAPFINPILLITSVLIIAYIGISQTGLYHTAPKTESARDTDYDNWQRVVTPDALFLSKIFLDRSSTYLTIPIRFEGEPKITWVSLDSTSSAQPGEFLMIHPKLETVDWDYVKRDVVYLYQRQNTYPSIEAFVANPPTRDKVIIEASIQKLDYYRNVPGYPLDDAFDPTKIDYILTTYNRPQKEGDIYYYENIIDATDGVTNADNNLSWRIYVPETSSASAYYLGPIHIDYNRTQ